MPSISAAATKSVVARKFQYKPPAINPATATATTRFMIFRPVGRISGPCSFRGLAEPAGRGFGKSVQIRFAVVDPGDHPIRSDQSTLDPQAVLHGRGHVS